MTSETAAIVPDRVAEHEIILNTLDERLTKARATFPPKEDE